MAGLRELLGAHVGAADPPEGGEVGGGREEGAGGGGRGGEARRGLDGNQGAMIDAGRRQPARLPDRDHLDKRRECGPEEAVGDEGDGGAVGALEALVGVAEDAVRLGGAEAADGAEDLPVADEDLGSGPLGL